MSSTENQFPKWFAVGNPMLWKPAEITLSHFQNNDVGNPDFTNAAVCASIHFIHCLNLSVDVNRKGQHAVAISLVRQCVESLTVIEISLLRDKVLRHKLLAEWLDNSKTSGGIRKELEKHVWPDYGKGLWTETWIKYFADFCKAVQPYAHYSTDLQGWQLAIVPNSASIGDDGKYTIASVVGLYTYEAAKATRITCLHCLLAWTLGRIYTANVVNPEFAKHLAVLGEALSDSDELCRGKVDWAKQFWATEFDRPKD